MALHCLPARRHEIWATRQAQELENSGSSCCNQTTKNPTRKTLEEAARPGSDFEGARHLAISAAGRGGDARGFSSLAGPKEHLTHRLRTGFAVTETVLKCSRRPLVGITFPDCSLGEQ